MGAPAEASFSFNNPNRPFDHVVFDLDDTLLDTYRQLIPKAARESCRAMIAEGLVSDIEACMNARDELVRHLPRQSLYDHLVSRFGVKPGADPANVARIGYDAFHVRKVETDIELFPGTRELLYGLRDRYGMHLVTAGNRATQEQKIRILGIEDLFAEIRHVDPSKGETKQSAFEGIMRTAGGEPSRYLSVGNRLDTDVADAKRLGWRACWIRYGEYAHMSPKDEFERPDFQINHLRELIAACRL